MGAPRFYVDPAAVSLREGMVALPEGVARHAVQVLRLRDGDPIVLFDGRGGEWQATLAPAGRAADARVLRHCAVEREAALSVGLVQAIVAPDAMDDVVRKAVELGAAGIVPVIAARTQRAPAERLERRVARWRQIVIAACEQCGRNRIPAVAPPVTLDQWVAGRGGCRDVLLLDPRSDVPLACAVAARAPHWIVVGPEGGLDDAERAALVAAGARGVQLGRAVLRADTAAVAALAAVQAALEGAVRGVAPPAEAVRAP